MSVVIFEAKVIEIDPIVLEILELQPDQSISQIILNQITELEILLSLIEINLHDGIFGGTKMPAWMMSQNLLQTFEPRP